VGLFADRGLMQKSDLKILIVDDDPTLALAMDEALRRAGYGVRRTPNYNEAKAVSKTTDFHGFVVDCMLPQKNGVDLALELATESQEDAVVVLTSGIYRDKAFAREAMHKARAKHFLFKPFDIETLVKTFDTEFAHLLNEKAGSLTSLLEQKDYSNQDRLDAVTKAGQIHGFDLPFVYALLAKKGIRGTLEITYENKRKSLVGFQDGRIDKLIHHDEESYFGVLLVEKGYTTLEAVEEGLALVDDRPLGERLVHSSAISPHVIEIIQLEQMYIRLSKTIQDTSVGVHFVPEERTSSVGIETPVFSRLLGDWIASKISTAWLKSFYMPWLDRPILRGPEFAKIELLVGHPVVKPLKDHLTQGEWPHTLHDLLDSHKTDEALLLRALHYLFLQRIFIFAQDEKSGPDWDKRLNRLIKIDAAMAGQNHFEVLGVSTKARTSEIHRAYQDLAKTLHPDRVPATAPREVTDLNHKIFTRITEAYTVLSNERKRDHYLKTLEMGLAEEILLAESVFEQGFNLLGAGRFRDARKSFEKAMKMKGHRSDLMVYLIWAYIYDKRNKVPMAELFEKVKSMIAQIAHEDRHSPHYFFVRGLYSTLAGDYDKALSAFRHTLTLEPGFAEARKEIALARKIAGQNKQSFSDDLSQVVTRFLKVKKR